MYIHYRNKISFVQLHAESLSSVKPENNKKVNIARETFSSPELNSLEKNNFH